MIAPAESALTTWWRLNVGVTLATTRAFVMRWATNTIMLLRSPIYPLIALVGYKLVYDISGQTTVPTGQVLGFLVTGLLAMGAWQATVWGAGTAIQFEMWSGTINSVVMAPGSMTGIVLGYTFGNFIFFMPAVVVTVIAGQLMGAEWTFDHPLAILCAFVGIYLSCVCVGLACAGLFILSRQANAMANFFQEPIHLLCGFYVSRELYPEWVQRLGDMLPVSHATDALRATVLDGQSFSQVADSLGWMLATCAAFAVIGVWSLRRLDRAVRRSGTLDIL